MTQLGIVKVEGIVVKPIQVQNSFEHLVTEFGIIKGEGISVKLVQ